MFKTAFAGFPKTFELDKHCVKATLAKPVFPLNLSRLGTLPRPIRTYLSVDLLRPCHLKKTI